MSDQSKAASSDSLRPVSDRETQVAFSGPAPLANKFFLHLAGLNGRIAFAEVGPDDVPVFRTAVALALPDLIALADVIQKVVKEHSDRHGLSIVVAPGASGNA